MSATPQASSPKTSIKNCKVICTVLEEAKHVRRFAPLNSTLRHPTFSRTASGTRSTRWRATPGLALLETRPQKQSMPLRKNGERCSPDDMEHHARLGSASDRATEQELSLSDNGEDYSLSSRVSERAAALLHGPGRRRRLRKAGRTANCSAT